MLVSACDYLDQDPGGMNTIEKVFASEVSTKEWYARMYSDDFMVQEMHYSGQIPYFWCTDESCYVMESNIKNISEGLMSPDNNYGYEGSYNLYFFVRYYQAIRHCNIFIENLNKCLEMGELERRTKMAEARFMRAYYHYLLLRLYGPIPIVDRSRSANEIAAPQGRTPFAECVQWISDEIDWACENGMPATRNASLELGLPTIGAAQAIKSRMFLMAASPLYNGNTIYASWTNPDGKALMPAKYEKELWLKAAESAKHVIDSYGYSLKMAPANATFDEYVDNIRSITTSWGENNPEVIWAHANSMQWYGMCALPARWFGWNGRYSLPAGFVNEFFMADGSKARPLEEWFENKQFSTKPGNGTIAETFWMFCNREPRFYANIHFPNQRLTYASPTEPDTAQDSDGYGVVDFWYRGASGHGSTPGDKNTSGFSVRKNIPLDYVSNKSKGTATRMLNCPFPIIRLGEIYLNYAEALNEYYGVEKQAEVLQYLNAIRTRAGIPAYTGAYTQEEMREMIRHERKIELSYECHRFFDVRRWFIAHGPEGVFNQNEVGLDMSKGTGPTDQEFFTLVQTAIKRFNIQHYFMPIKASECELNGALVQAPFY